MTESKNNSKNAQMMAQKKEEMIYVYELQFGKSDNYDYIRSRQYSTKIECLKNLIKRYEDEKSKGGVSYIQGRIINLITGEYYEV